VLAFSDEPKVKVSTGGRLEVTTSPDGRFFCNFFVFILGKIFQKKVKFEKLTNLLYEKSKSGSILPSSKRSITASSYNK
jgi:hypothetical protein